MRKAIFIFIAIILVAASIDWIHSGITSVPVPMTYSPSMPFPSVRTLFVCVLHHFKILHYLLQPIG